ncbi:hypothetical protein BCR37DRAFT_382036 [Protomyces lactucae-debilis]|uniref:Secreted protein n=1 Tax=Protomyces lactucae-debilis TaxID=2754530 RepID=A0A1Y2F5W7_PROLT|nr:uncharacterized protein BCR37DRAFT_382036 [Protomyces lactucae-debilis]ORY79057.1 hypothetical protein BCR37DRAFT_382036 [Protomyces lactucae-debilis]
MVGRLRCCGDRGLLLCGLMRVYGICCAGCCCRPRRSEYFLRRVTTRVRPQTCNGFGESWEHAVMASWHCVMVAHLRKAKPSRSSFWLLAR